MNDANGTYPEFSGKIVNHLKELLAGNEAATSLHAQSDLIGGGLLDSLNIVRLIQFVESEFGVRIPDDAIGPDIFSSAEVLAGFVAQQKT